MNRSVSHEGTQLVTIAKNAGLGIGGRFFFLSVRFCIVILITRTIGPERYGIFILAMSIVGIIEVLSLMGLEPAMVKFVSQYRAQENIFLVKGVIGFGLKVSLISSGILAVGFFLSADLVAHGIFHKVALVPVLRVMLLGVPFFSLMLIILSALQGAKLVKYRILVQQVLMPMFRFAVIAMAFWCGYRIMGVAWAWAITSIFGFLLSVIFMTKNIACSFKRSLEVQRRKIFFFSLPLLFSRLFYQNISMIGILIIGAFLPADQVGIYGVAMRVVPLLLIPLLSYNAIFSPIISDLFTKGKMKELANIYKTGSKWVITISLPIFALVVFFSKEILTIFGSGFGEAAQIMIIVLIGQIFNVSSGSTGIMLSMTGKTLYNLVNSGALCLVNLVLTLLLVSRFGTIGVACAYSLSIILIQLLQMGEVWYLYRLHPYSLGHVKPILSCICSIIIIYLIKGPLPIAHGLISALTIVVVFLCSYGIFLMLAGLSSDDRMILEKIRHKILRRRGAVIQ